MKKIISVILAVAALLTLAACKVKPSGNKETEPYRPEDFQAQVSQLQAERASEEAEKQKEKDKINDEIADYVEEEVGKTKKNKAVVIKIVSERSTEYQKYVYNKKGEIDYRLNYYFFNKKEDYNSCIAVTEEDKYRSVVKKDKDKLMVVVKYTDVTPSSYDELYETYKKPEVIALGYQLVE